VGPLIWRLGRGLGRWALLALIKNLVKKSCLPEESVKAWLMGSYHLFSPPWSAPQSKDQIFPPHVQAVHFGGGV